MRLGCIPGDRTRVEDGGRRVLGDLMRGLGGSMRVLGGLMRGLDW